MICPSMYHRSHDQWGESLSRGGVSVRGSLSKGVSVQRSLSWGDPRGQRPPRIVKGGQYASYWNTFLFLPPVVKLGQGYVFTRVCDSVHRGGCLLPRGCLLWGCVETPPRRLLLRAVRILLECILVTKISGGMDQRLFHNEFKM